MSDLSNYEDLLIGKANPKSLIIRGTEDEQEETALNIWRYAIKNLLHWQPQDAAECIDKEIVKNLKLDVTLKYIPAPPDLDINEDFDYIVHLAFPKDVPYDPTEQAIKMYKRILAGAKAKFPKKYFKGPYCYYKAGVLLQYAISNYIPFNDIAELYQMFADTTKTNAKLKELKLYEVSKDLYNTPLDFFHSSLPDSQKDMFLYKYYKFMQSFKAATTYKKREKNHEKEDDKLTGTIQMA